MRTTVNDPLMNDQAMKAAVVLAEQLEIADNLRQLANCIETVKVEATTW